MRLRVYQKLSQAETSQDLQFLRAELKDRFGTIPEPAEHLLLWLQLKVLAQRARVTSIATGEDEIAVRLPAEEPGRPGGAVDRATLQRQVDPNVVRIGPQFARINRRAAGERWAEVLRELLELLAAEGDVRSV